MEAQFKPGDIFEGEYMHAGSYYQVTASTEKTVTVRPIESGYAGQGRVYTAHSYESLHTPVSGYFCSNGYWPSDVCRRGKRCTLTDNPGKQGGKHIKIGSGVYASPWDGNITAIDHYS